MERILIIDDDVALSELLTEYLIPEGFHVESVQDGETGLEKAAVEYMTLLFLMLCSLLSMALRCFVKYALRPIRPLVMLTARGEEVDRIVGLEIGADDYLPKPFNPRELVARIRAILRRTRREQDQYLTPLHPKGYRLAMWIWI